MICFARKRFVVIVVLLLAGSSLFAQHTLWRSSFRFPGKELEGMLLVKESDSAFRYVLMAATGFKIADFAVSKKRFDYNFNYTIPDLDKKQVKLLLARSFYLLGFETGKNAPRGRRIAKKDASGNRIVFLYDSNGNLLKKRGFGLFNRRVRVIYKKDEITVKQLPLTIRLWR